MLIMRCLRGWGFQGFQTIFKISEPQNSVNMIFGASVHIPKKEPSNNDHVVGNLSLAPTCSPFCFRLIDLTS